MASVCVFGVYLLSLQEARGRKCPLSISLLQSWEMRKVVEPLRLIFDMSLLPIARS